MRTRRGSLEHLKRKKTTSFVWRSSPKLRLHSAYVLKKKCAERRFSISCCFFPSSFFLSLAFCLTLLLFSYTSNLPLVYSCDDASRAFILVVVALFYLVILIACYKKKKKNLKNRKLTKRESSINSRCIHSH